MTAACLEDLGSMGNGLLMYMMVMKTLDNGMRQTGKSAKANGILIFQFLRVS